MMKKYVLSVLCLLLVGAFALTGCTAAPAEAPVISPLPGAAETAIPDNAKTAAPEETAVSAPTPTAAPTANQSFSTPAPDAPYTLENFPIIDGSLANVPLVDLLTQRMLGVDADTAAALTAANFSNTNPSYLALCEGRVQLVLAYEPSADTVETMQESGAKLEQAEIGRDALVFLTGKDNPVDSLTVEQLVGIYSGEITNWSEVGGKDEPIIPYQRREDSGSQTLMRKLVMGDVEMMVPPTEQVIEEMGELIDKVAEFGGETNALGFSVYYYVANMYDNENIKMIAVEGVTPSNETIESGAYSLVNPFYATIRQDAAADSPEREIFQWLQTEEGTALIREAGYVPAGKN